MDTIYLYFLFTAILGGGEADCSVTKWVTNRNPEKCLSLRSQLRKQVSSYENLQKHLYYYF